MKKLYFLSILVSFLTFFKSQTITKDLNYTGNFGTVGIATPQFGANGEIYKLLTGNRLMRYTDTGSFDTNFGVNGYLTFLPQSTNINQVTSTGIYTLLYNSQTSNRIVKYTLAGTVDNSFGTNGDGISEELFAVNSGIVAQQLVINSDESIYVRISGNQIMKILPNGTLDADYGTKIFNDNVSILQSSDNSLLVKYNNGTSEIISKYTPQGIIDSTFGNAGELIIEIPVGLINIFTNKLNEFFILSRSGGFHYITKYTESGKDLDFATNGTFSIASSSLLPGSLSMTLSKIDFDSTHKILLFGTVAFSPSFFNMISIQYNVDGLPNNNFNGDKNYFLTNSATNMIYYRNYKIVEDNKFFFMTAQNIAAPNLTDLTGYKYIKSDALNTVDYSEKKGLEIYPNPVSDFLNIKLNTKENLQKITIYSADGKLISTFKDLRNNVQFLSPGIYLTEIITDKNKYYQKIIKK